MKIICVMIGTEKIVDGNKIEVLRGRKMNENYIMLNGKRVDLTDEQLEKLGIKVEKDNFKRKISGYYYCITEKGNVERVQDINLPINKKCYNIANYCLDEKVMQQRALRETLSRLLWRFSMQNDGDKIDWKNKNSYKYHIYFDYNRQEFAVTSNSYCQTIECAHFNTREIAQRAIDEIILPFMEEHPEFVM